MANVTDPNVGGIDPLKPPVPPSSVVPPVGDKLPEIDERVRAEIVDLERRMAELEAAPKDGSGLETAKELHRLSEIVSEKAAELKRKAEAAFLGKPESKGTIAMTELNGSNAPQQLNDSELSTDVKEQIADIESQAATIQRHGPEEDPAAVADLLDNAALTLEQKARDMVERQRDVAAQELNDLDGFDR
jgi:hypothetical protein